MCTAHENDIILAAIFFRVRRPRSAAFRVTRREMRHQRHTAEFNFIAIVQFAIGLDRWKTKFVTEEKIVFAAARERLGIFLHREELRSGLLLQFREAAHVIVMRMTGEQNLYVAQVEPKLFDIRFNKRRRFLETAVDYDVTGGRSNEIRTDFRYANIIDVADDLEGRDRLVPRAIPLVCLREDINCTKAEDDGLKIHLQSFGP